MGKGLQERLNPRSIKVVYAVHSGYGDSLGNGDRCGGHIRDLSFEHGIHTRSGGSSHPTQAQHTAVVTEIVEFLAVIMVVTDEQVTADASAELSAKAVGSPSHLAEKELHAFKTYSRLFSGCFP